MHEYAALEHLSELKKKSLVRSLQTKNENGNVDIPTLENHSQEMSRCLSDLIKLFQSNPALARKLEEVT